MEALFQRLSVSRDTNQLTAAEISYRSVVSHSLGNTLDVLDAYAAETRGKQLYSGDVVAAPPFPRVKLSHICPGALSTWAGETYGDREFALIGTWAESPWTVSIAISPSPLDPLSTGGSWVASTIMFFAYDYETIGLDHSVLLDVSLGLGDRNDYQINGTPARGDYVPNTNVFDAMLDITFSSAKQCVAFAISDTKWRDTMVKYALKRDAPIWLTLTMEWCMTISPPVASLSTLSTTTDPLLLKADVLQIVVENLDLVTISRLRATCRTVRTLLSDVAGSRTRHVLEPFFPRAVPAFGDCLDRTGSIVSGSSALSIFRPDPSRWSPSDLDIVCPNRFSGVLLDFLTSQGFILENQRNHGEPAPVAPQENQGSEAEDYPGPTLITGALFNWRQFRRGPCKIDVSICFPERDGMTPAQFILTYHSSVVMQFITPRSIYSFFPKLTSNGLVMRNRRKQTPRTDSGVVKYFLRGYTELIEPMPTSDVPIPFRRHSPAAKAALQDKYKAFVRGRWLRVEKMPSVWNMDLSLHYPSPILESNEQSKA